MKKTLALLSTFLVVVLVQSQLLRAQSDYTIGGQVSTAGLVAPELPTPTPWRLYTIYGQISTGEGRGIDGVTIAFFNFDGEWTHYEKTAGGGHYSYSVLAGWTGTVTPSHVGYTFSPVFASIDPIYANILQNFVATFTTHLPLVFRNPIIAPDLVVESITATSDDVQVVIRNAGNGPVSDEFWVDVYIDPNPVPTAVNQIWPDLASQGLAWGVTADLQPGDVLTLSASDALLDYSEVSWPLAAGTQVYAQVDSCNTETTYGAVLESHEITGGPYNNIGSTQVPGTSQVPAISFGFR